jgi:hypothetical protein
MAEWRPHQLLPDGAGEYWHLSSLVFDSAGHCYFLTWRLSRSRPEPAGPSPGQDLAACLIGVSDYETGSHFCATAAVTAGPDELWSSHNAAVRFSIDGHRGEWAFRSDAMRLSVDSPRLCFDFDLTGCEQVMSTIDTPSNGHRYSLPRLDLRGHLLIADDSGRARDIEVHGSAWVDRHWGGRGPQPCEWSSLRFVNGARVGLWQFGAGHRVATYQHADATTEWLDGFVVQRNSYPRTPSDDHTAWGWTYRFATKVEGSRSFTLEPYSRRGAHASAEEAFIEGPSRLIDNRTGAVVGTAVTSIAGFRRLVDLDRPGH